MFRLNSCTLCAPVPRTQAGATTLDVSFGASPATRYPVAVQDTFQPGWPTVTQITDTGFRLAANMTDDVFVVTYLVRPTSAQAAPTPAQVEQGKR